MKRKNNYLDVIEKRAKSCFKGKFKVTLALIVSLMISGVAMAVEEEIVVVDGKAIWENTGEDGEDGEDIVDINSDTGFGVKVTGVYPSADEVLTSKVEVDITNEGTLTVINSEGGNSNGIYIPGTDKLFEFYLDEKRDPYGNSYFRVDNSGKIDVDGFSAYGIHLKFVEPIESIVPLSIVALDEDEDEEDPVYAYPDIEIINSEKVLDGESSEGKISVQGDVEAEGIRIDTPFAKVSIDNSGTISAEVGVETEEVTKEEFGGATGINIFIPTEEELPENPTPEWDMTPVAFSSDEEEISSLPMDVDITNTGDIKVDVENRDVARIMGINVGEYDDHTLTSTTEIIETVVTAGDESEIKAVATSVLTPTPTVALATEVAPDGISLLSSSSDHGGSSGSGGCGTKPLDAMVDNDITNEGSILVKGNNLSAVQAVGINSRMAEGTQTTIINGAEADITVGIVMTDARQTTVDEDPTSGNLYGINVFNSGRPSRVDTYNKGIIDVDGSILAEGTTDKTTEDPVGIQAFGIKNKARGRDSVADINNTGEIIVTTSEKQNTAEMKYEYTRDTEGKEIFGARAVGIAGTSAGRGAYTEITNGDYDIDTDQIAMDDKRANEEVDVYALVQAEMMRRYEEEYEEMYTFKKDAVIVAKIEVNAESDQGFAEAKGIWSTSEAIENSQFVYNSENSSIEAIAKSPERGAEALGIESVSYQNTVINQGLIQVTSDGKTATGIGILAEVSEIEEEEMNEHMKKPEFLGADIGMPPDLPGNRDDHQGGENSGGGEDTIVAATTFAEPAISEVALLAAEDEGTPNGEVSQGEDGSGDGATDTNQPEIGIRNKYILNTGDINVDVKSTVSSSSPDESGFAFGAGIAASRVVLETVRNDRVDDSAWDLEEDREETSIQAFALAVKAAESDEPTDDIDGVGGASVTAAPEESLNQYITNNGNIAVKVEGDTALASGISSLTKVEVLFDRDGDGVSDGVDANPYDPALSHDLDNDGIDDKVDTDADGDGFISVAYGGTDYFDHDTDNDGINNRMDNDEDGDGILDVNDPDFNEKYENMISSDGATLKDEEIGSLPISDEAYEEFMDTPGGMPENLIETTGILEAEEAEINNKLVNNGSIVVTAVSDAEDGIAIANGIATDVVWAGLQKPIYVEPEIDELPEISPTHSEEEVVTVTVPVIEKNYDNFANNGDIEVGAGNVTIDDDGKIIIDIESTVEGITAAAFGMRIGNYYTIDDADSERSPITKHYAGDYEEVKEGFEATEYGLENAGEITVTASGNEAKAFGMMSGYSNEEDESNEEFVVSTVKNTGTIDVTHEGTENSEGAGIVAFADQQIEYLPEVLEGGVLLAAVEEEEDDISPTEELIFEDYVVKNPERAVAIVENSGTITINDETGDKNYGIYAGINPAEINPLENREPISVKEIVLLDDDGNFKTVDENGNPMIIEDEAIMAETQNGNDGESVLKQIGTLYTVIIKDDDGDELEKHQFVIHAPEDMGEEMPDRIYVVDEGGDLTPSVEETYKLGETYLEVNNSGTINAGSGVGIYLATEGKVENSGTISASKAIVGSEGNDVIELLDGSEIYGDIETRGGDDRLNLDSGSYMNGNIDTGMGNDRIEIFQRASFKGDIRLGDGDDRLSLGEDSFMTGNIDTGRGNDRVKVSQGAQLKGNIDLGPGNDFFTLESGGFSEDNDETTYTVDGGEGFDRITLIGSEENSDQNVLDRQMQNFEMAQITGKWKLNDRLSMPEGGRIINKGKIKFDGDKK